MLAALEELRGLCVLCWLATDSVERDHVAFQCKLEARGDAYAHEMRYMDVPSSKPERVCYGCYVPTHTFKIGTHGNASKQNMCHFAHILRPLVWGCWHLQTIREELVEGFGLDGIQSWEGFFNWAFKASAQEKKLMNLLFVLVWLVKRSASVSI